MSEQETSQINIPYPDAGQPRLRITAAPARLIIAPGEADPWVTGTYTDPAGGSSYRVSSGGSETHLSHDRRLSGLRKGVPQFDLLLGTATPYSLVIETGASDRNRCDLGGIPLTGLDCRQGAGEFILDISRPNPVEMGKLSVSSGASAIELRNLANSNASEVTITGGAASFLVDFSGALQRDMKTTINAGVAEIRITAPRETAIKVRPNATLASVKVGDGFMTREGSYWSETAVRGETPELALEIITALGSVKVDLV